MEQLSLPSASVANLHFVTPRLAVGGGLSPRRSVARRQIQELAELGITHILDARLEWQDEELVRRHAPALAYLHHGVDDAGQTLPPEWFDHGVSWAMQALSDPDAVVLAHCHMGINRGPSMGFAILLAQGHEPVEALTMIRAVRPIAAIAYAEDALDWHHAATATPAARVEADIAAVQQWRRDNYVDVVRLVRELEEGDLDPA